MSAFFGSSSGWKQHVVSTLSLGLTILLLLGLSGCYSRVEIKPRATPPVAKMHLQFSVDQSVLDYSQSGNAYVQTNGDAQLNALMKQNKESTLAQAKSLGDRLAGLMTADLVNKNIAFPVRDTQKESDLRLKGVFRGTSTGIVLDWQLEEVRSGTIVKAGVTTSRLLSDPEPHADEILLSLLKMDIDTYAQARGGEAPLAAMKASTSLDDAPKSGTMGSNDWAVVIGIERYRESLPEATFAEADAKVFASYLEETFGVPATHIKLLVGNRAGRADISSAIEEWLPRNAKGKGKVYIFFSGHGAPDVETGDAYLVPYDADPAYLKTRGYGIQSLYSNLERLEDRQVYVFLDACFSGSGDRSVLAAGTRPLVLIKETAPPVGIVTLAASKANQTTGAAEAGGHGLFTHHLLSGLSGAADLNADQNITLEELSQHVMKAVEEEARLQNREQQPTLSFPPGFSASKVNLVQKLQSK